MSDNAKSVLLRRISVCGFLRCKHRNPTVLCLLRCTLLVDYVSSYSHNAQQMSLYGSFGPQPMSDPSHNADYGILTGTGLTVMISAFSDQNSGVLYGPPHL